MRRPPVYLGVDVGSVSTNLVLMNASSQSIVDKIYLRTAGQPIKTLQNGMKKLRSKAEWEVKGVGVTGSGRELSGVMLGGDVIKNEITAHAVAASLVKPDVRTVLEIGGQDSKIIILRDGIVTDFAMNTVCAAGTGSFLDQQASRLDIPIDDFGTIALRSSNPVRIAGRCTVFAESDMIHKQQLGHQLPDILQGLCEAMVRNYLNNVGKGKEIRESVVFQGGVAANQAMRKAFEDALEMPITVPPHFEVMGAIGAAQLAKEQHAKTDGPTKFLGFEMVDREFKVDSFECHDCPNTCEIVSIYQDGEPVACWGSRCGKYERTVV